MLKIDLTGKIALVAGVADDEGFGWAIAKALHAAGAKVIIGCWPPALNILRMSLERGKLDVTQADGSVFTIERIYPVDAIYDTLADAPEEVRSSRRYSGQGDFSIQGLVDTIEKEYGRGTLNIVVHSLANGPEVQKPLAATSRSGYLAALSASAYSFVSMVQRFSPIMERGGAFLSLTYLAAERVVPGYGGGMSSAKAALESDTRTLAYEIGREYHHRVNTISAGPLASRAARSIGIIEKMITFSADHAPLADALTSQEVGNTAAFLASPLASGITGATIYVDKGMHSMALAPKS